MTYAKLTEVSKRTGKSETDLLRLGATGGLPVYVVPHPSWQFQMQYVKAVQHSDDVTDYHCIVSEVGGVLMVKMLLRVAPLYLENYINYPDSAEIDVFLPDGVLEGDVSVVRYIGDAPLLVKNCCLVVKTDDFSLLKGASGRKMLKIVPLVETIAPPDSTSRANSGQPPLTESKKKRVAPSPNAEFLRIADVAALLSVSEGTVRNYMKREDFPTPVQLGTRTVGWKRIEVQAWIDKRPKK